MTPEQAAELKRLAEEYVDDAIYMENPERDSGVAICNYEASQKAFWAYIDSLTQDAQPVAWLSHRDNSDGFGEVPWLNWSKQFDGDTPLYTHPQLSKPLSRAQKAQMWLAATIELPSHENCYLRGIADAERAHGIKEQS